MVSNKQTCGMESEDVNCWELLSEKKAPKGVFFYLKIYLRQKACPEDIAVSVSEQSRS